jgi:hypothetical protein
MEDNRVLPRLWDFADYAQEHAVLDVHNHTAHKALNWKTPLKVKTGIRQMFHICYTLIFINPCGTGIIQIQVTP